MNDSSPHAGARPRHSDPALSWPWRESTGPELLWDSHAFLPAILEAIEDARSRIDMEIYLCESGGLFQRFLEVLGAAHARGVTVRLLLDAIGSAGLRDRDRQRLRELGVELRFFNPIHVGHQIQALVRDHRKLILIDDHCAFTGGMCISDEYDPDLSGPDTWLDAMVRVRGEAVSDCRELFEQAWELAGRGRVREAMRWRLRAGLRDTPPLQPRVDVPQARLCAARGGRHNPLLVSLVRRIRLARREIWLCTPYFFPPRSLITVICRAACRGVKVTLTLPGPITDHPAMRTAGHHFYGRLLAAGVIIREYQPRFIHLKAVIVDDWVTLGSSNYDRWNLRWNLDANLEVLDDDFLQSVRNARDGLTPDCITISPQAWSRRGTWERWRERFWHWLGTRTLRWLHKFRP